MEEEMMLDKKSNKKKVILLAILLLIVIVGTIGVAYATYRFQTEGDSSELITGDIYMHYKGQNTGISIDNAVSSKTYDKEKYFEFTIEGKNTYTEKDIWYEIDLIDGDQPDGRTTRIDDKYLRFTLIEKIGSGPEKTVVNSVGYDDITNKKIWVNKIDKNTNEEIKITYKLYMWINDEVHIGYDDEGEIEFDYTNEEWANEVYASVKVNVKGDFLEKSIDNAQYSLPLNMIERLKKITYTDKKEMIALDVTNKSNVTKCASEEACKGEKLEYRYSGPEVNNYIYLKDNNNSNELWRIIGIFEDEKAGQYIKVVRDSVLPDSYLTRTFKADDGNTYLTKSSSYGLVHWNRLEPSTSKEKNNWPTAGLQYWLNAEENDTEGNKNYLSYLSSVVRDQLVEVKHYLGSVHAYNTAFSLADNKQFDTPLQAYAHERDVESCAASGEKGPGSNNSEEAMESESSGCHVWAGNDATWTGKVSLMYPSDYGLSASENNWTTLFWSKSERSFKDEEVAATSWIYSTMTGRNYDSWLLSPVSNSSNSVAHGTSERYIISYGVYGSLGTVRPVLNLSSSTTWLDGDGTKNDPYKIIAD